MSKSVALLNYIVQQAESKKLRVSSTYCTGMIDDSVSDLQTSICYGKSNNPYDDKNDSVDVESDPTPYFVHNICHTIKIQEFLTERSGLYLFRIL